MANTKVKRNQLFYLAIPHFGKINKDYMRDDNLHSQAMSAVLYVLGPKHEKRPTPFSNECKVLLIGANQRAQQSGKHDSMYALRPGETTLMDILSVGVKMENVDAVLKAVVESCEESKEEIQNIVNTINAVYDPLMIRLGEMVKEVRTKKGTITREMGQSLTVMKDVRQFFLGKDYKTEMDRLERFVVLGERLKALINDGTMDAVCDVMLKLAVAEEEAPDK